AAARTPAGDLVATVAALQATAGNRATAALLAGRTYGRRMVQRDALGGRANDEKPALDPSGIRLDPSQLTRDGTTGPKASQWATPGQGGDGPAPPIAVGEAREAGAAVPGAAGPGLTGWGELTGNLPGGGADAAIALSGGSAQGAGQQGAGQQGAGQ